MIGAIKQNSGRKNYQSDIMQTEKHKEYLDNEHDIMGHHLLKGKLQKGHLCKDGTSLQRTYLCKDGTSPPRHHLRKDVIPANVDLHSIGTMMGFHAVTLWQNETFHFLYRMNIIIETHFNSQTGKIEPNSTS
jgi:hypothetical protein